MAEVYIIESVRTPMGIGKRHKGDLYPIAHIDPVVTELLERSGRYGPQTLCIGHGIATATVIETVG